tara:strand:- start:91 stop:612 length:522 start_codon:yes stop_codon:yes gene_type:complete
MDEMNKAMGAEKGLGDLIQQAEAQDSQFMDAIALEGTFTDKGMKALVSAIESALPAMGMKGADAKVEAGLAEDGTVTEELMRPLMVVVDPINDAVEEGILDSDLTIDLEAADEDRDLTMVASRIRMAFADKGFKRWLGENTEEEPEEEPGSVTEEEPTTESDAEIDDFFMSRL